MTVELTLKQPDGNLIYNLAWGDAVIVAPESAEANKTNPIGTGPFAFKDRVEGDSITLEKNQSYWGDPGEARQRDLPVHRRPDGRFRCAAGR